MHRSISSTIAAESRRLCPSYGTSRMFFRPNSVDSLARPVASLSVGRSLRSTHTLTQHQRMKLMPKRARSHSKSTFVIRNNESSSSSSLGPSTPAVVVDHPVGLSRQQIQSIVLSSAIPMVGFGFMDNVIMIQAGSVIDNTLGVQLGLATMTAAALGQVVSDTCGVLFGGTLERLMVVQPAKLTEAQQRLAVIPRLRLAGAVAGVIVGCSLGACTLFLLPDKKRNEANQFHATTSGATIQRLQAILHDMVTSVHEPWLTRGTSCVLYIKDPSSFSPSSEDSSLPVSIARLSGSEESMAIQCAETAQVTYDDNTIYIPVIDSQEDTVLAVLKLIQRIDRGNETSIFTKADVNEAEKVARHLGIFMRHLRLD